MKITNSKKIFAMILGMLVFGIAFSSLAKIIEVTNPNDTSPGAKGKSGGLSLRQAIEIAEPEDTIELNFDSDTTYLDSPYTPSKEIYIDFKNKFLCVKKGFDCEIFICALGDTRPDTSQMTFENFTTVPTPGNKVTKPAIVVKNKRTSVNFHHIAIKDYVVGATGGVIYNEGNLNMTNCNVLKNKDMNGIQMYNGAKFMHKNTTFKNADGVDTDSIFNTGNFEEILKKDNHVTIWLPKKTKQSQQTNFL